MDQGQKEAFLLAQDRQSENRGSSKLFDLSRLRRSREFTIDLHTHIFVFVDTSASQSTYGILTFPCSALWGGSIGGWTGEMYSLGGS